MLRVKPLGDGRVSDNVTVVDSEMVTPFQTPLSLPPHAQGGASVILKKSKKTEDLFQVTHYTPLLNLTLF